MFASVREGRRFGFCFYLFSGGIESVSAPGVAAGDSLGGAPGAADRAVFVDGVDGVLGAGGDVAAVAAEESAEGGAVEEDEVDEEPAHWGGGLVCQVEWSLSMRAVRSF